MGVPSLYHYLVNKFPSIVQQIPKTDILCLDFNSIVHNCVRNSTEEEVIDNVYEYLDTLIKHTTPKIVYIAVDGVAPRAKMNQQRARRYGQMIEDIAKQESRAEGIIGTVVDSPKTFEGATANLEDDSFCSTNSAGCTALFDKNSITPGTPFMAKLDKSIDEFLSSKIKGEYRNMRVVYSGSNVPGEGEQKIIEFLKSEAQSKGKEGASYEYGSSAKFTRSSQNRANSYNNHSQSHARPSYARSSYANQGYTNQGYANQGYGDQSYTNQGQSNRDACDGNSPHNNTWSNNHRPRIVNTGYTSSHTSNSTCVTIYSPDADFFFLTLPLSQNIFILKEELLRFKCKICSKKSHSSENCKNINKTVFCSISMNELKRHLINSITKHLKMSFDKNRIINDFIFICFLCGNDFLPTLPCFNIKFEAIDILGEMLVSFYNNRAKYLTKNDEIIFDNFKLFLHTLKENEDKIYKRKSILLKMERKKFGNENGEEIDLSMEYGKVKYYKEKVLVGVERSCNDTGATDAFTNTFNFSTHATCDGSKNATCNGSKNATCNAHTHATDNFSTDNFFTHAADSPFKDASNTSTSAVLSLFDNETFDSLLNVRKKVAHEYLKGLSWSFALYLNNLKSWEWFYPYHYAPLACDLALISNFDFHFALGKPLSTIEQALLVLPVTSKHNIPACLHVLYENLSFFPREFDTDMFDKLLPWQAVVLLPFVDVNEILSEYRKYKNQMEIDEVYRNVEGFEVLYSKNEVCNWFYGGLADYCYGKCDIKSYRIVKK